LLPSQDASLAIAGYVLVEERCFSLDPWLSNFAYIGDVEPCSLLDARLSTDASILDCIPDDIAYAFQGL